jgi:hypothetical protein
MEAESAAAAMVAHDILYVYRLMGSIGLSVELPMLLEMDKNCAVDTASDWSVGGQTHHVVRRNHFWHELNDKRLLVIKHILGDENEADIFTKSTTAPLFNRQIPKFVVLITWRLSNIEPEASEGVGAQILSPVSVCFYYSKQVISTMFC